MWKEIEVAKILMASERGPEATQKTCSQFVDHHVTSNRVLVQVRYLGQQLSFHHVLRSSLWVLCH